MIPLKRRGHDRSATTGYGGMKLAVGPGFEPGSCRVTGGRVAVATTLQPKKQNEAGCQTWTRTTIRGFRDRCPAVGRSGNGRVGRTRTSTRLRPRQVGCQLPYDPIDDGVTARIRTGTRRATTSRAAVTPRPHTKVIPRVWPWMVAGEGIEPPCAVCRTAVLPLNEPAVVAEAGIEPA
jgi:hypothetical protein